MSIAATCPRCGGHNSMPEDLAGRSGFCAHCGEIIDVPGETSETALSRSTSARQAAHHQPVQRNLLLAGVFIGLSAIVSVAMIVIAIAKWPSLLPDKSAEGGGNPALLPFDSQPQRLAPHEIEVAPGVVLAMKWREALSEPDWFRRDLARMVYEMLQRDDFAGADASRVELSIELIGSERVDLLREDGTTLGEHSVDQLRATAVFVDASGQTLWRHEFLLYPSRHPGVRIADPLLSQTVSDVANIQLRLLAAKGALGQIAPPR